MRHPINSLDWAVMPDGRTVATLIDDAWDRLAELQDAGALSAAQFAYLLRLEGTTHPSPYGQRFLLGALQRAIADPASVGTNLDAFKTYPCSCGDGYGWVTVDDGSTHGAMRPCDKCNGRAYVWWVECHLQGCRGCDRCKPGARRRGMQADHQAEVNENRQRRTLDDLA